MVNIAIKAHVQDIPSFVPANTIKFIIETSNTVTGIIFKNNDMKKINPENILKIKPVKNVNILWASTREPYNYIQAKQLGCQIITVPPSIIEKIEKFGKTFQKLTTDTVKGFLIDTKKSKFKI